MLLPFFFAIIIVAIMTLISGIVAAISGANSGNSSEYTDAAYGQAYDLSDNTQMFVAELYTACENYDVLHWFEALKAIMEIESGGEGPEWADRMCCSESQQNYEYPRYPGSITSVAYSMDAGVRTWISLCEYTGLTDASQESLLLATVQCYNFGPGFWDYLTSDESKYYGEFTPIAAETYQQYYRDKYGWTPGNAEYTDRFREHYKFPRELSFDTGGGSMISGAFDGTIGWPINLRPAPHIQIIWQSILAQEQPVIQFTLWETALLFGPIAFRIIFGVLVLMMNALGVIISGYIIQVSASKRDTLI